MAAKGEGEIQYPSSSLVKYLNIAAAALGIASVVLDARSPSLSNWGSRNRQKRAWSGQSR